NCIDFFFSYRGSMEWDKRSFHAGTPVVFVIAEYGMGVDLGVRVPIPGKVEMCCRIQDDVKHWRRVDICQQLHASTERLTGSRTRAPYQNHAIDKGRQCTTDRECQDGWAVDNNVVELFSQQINHSAHCFRCSQLRGGNRSRSRWKNGEVGTAQARYQHAVEANRSGEYVTQPFAFGQSKRERYSGSPEISVHQHRPAALSKSKGQVDRDRCLAFGLKR